jgi:competence protein ComEC
VGRFFLTETGMKSEEIGDLVALSKMRNVPVVPMSEETPDLNINGAVVEFLHPPSLRKMDGETRAAVTEDVNNTSLVFRIKYGDFTLMMTGDIEAEAEALILSQGGDIKSTLLKSPHHGSSTSSTPEFLDAVCPEAVVISCGEKSRFGFPGDEVLERYGDYGYVVFRTDADGAVTVESDGSGYTVESVNGRSLRCP